MNETPHWVCNIEAEQSVLGALLVDNGSLDAIGDLLREADFYTAEHQAVFRSASRLILAGKAADVVTVWDALKAEDANRWAKSLGYIGDLAMSGLSSNVRRYAEIVSDHAKRRRLFASSQEIVQALSAKPRMPLGELKDLAESSVLSACADGSGGNDFVDLQSSISRAMEEIDRRYNDRKAGISGELVGAPTGFSELDRETLGMQGGQLIIVGARPAMGKTSFALNVAENCARAEGKPALVFSMEMGERQLTYRLLAADSGINVQRLYTGRLNEDEWARMVPAIGRLSSLPVQFCERSDLRMGDIRALARRAKRQANGLSLIVVDYLQLMLGADSEANRAAQLSEITRGLKNMARELDVPVMALSQLNRELEKRTNKRPMVADLRDSGSIEQDADNIYFIYRDEVYNPRSEDRGIAEIIIAKQRDGPTGTVRLSFRADHTRFSDYRGEQVRAVA